VGFAARAARLPVWRCTGRPLDRPRRRTASASAVPNVHALTSRRGEVDLPAEPSGSDPIITEIEALLLGSGYDNNVVRTQVANVGIDDLVCARKRAPGEASYCLSVQTGVRLKRDRSAGNVSSGGGRGGGVRPCCALAKLDS
jgi:hypothetical protein